MIYLCALSDPLRDLDYALTLKRALEEAGYEVSMQSDMNKMVYGREKAEQFNEALNHADWILDLSGGNLANLSLPWLDGEAYAASNAIYMGFSDNTVVVNGLYALSGKETVLYPLCSKPEPERVIEALQALDNGFDSSQNLKEVCPEVTMALGGNIRCFLKLAGTPFMPVEENYALYIESLSAGWYSTLSMLEHLGQAGLLEHAACLIIGEFTMLSHAMPNYAEAMAEYIEENLDARIPVYHIDGFGHDKSALPVWIGRPTQKE